MSQLFATVEFKDQLHAVSRPVNSLDAGQQLIANECSYPNTFQAYVWRLDNGLVLASAIGRTVARTLNIDTLVEDYRI